jgi:hypothetical protein
MYLKAGSIALASPVKIVVSLGRRAEKNCSSCNPILVLKPSV